MKVLENNWKVRRVLVDYIYTHMHTALVRASRRGEVYIGFVLTNWPSPRVLAP